SRIIGGRGGPARAALFLVRAGGCGAHAGPRHRSGDGGRRLYRRDAAATRPDASRLDRPAGEPLPRLTLSFSRKGAKARRIVSCGNAAFPSRGRQPSGFAAILFAPLRLCVKIPCAPPRTSSVLIANLVIPAKAGIALGHA